MIGLMGQQGLKNPDATNKGQDSTGFYRNPNEEKERAERDKEYQELYEEDLTDSALTQNILLQKVFEPRVHDEMFDTNLPGERKSGQWSLDVRPNLGDFFGDEYVRFQVGLEYSWSQQLQVFSDFQTYFANPFENESGAGWYNWRVGAKYSWMDVRNSGWNVAVGFKANMPLRFPPIELSDGYARYEPYVSISRQLEKHVNWLVYFNMSYQFVETSPFKSAPIQPQPKDRIFLRPGFIYYPGGNYRYSVELEYRTNALDFREEEKPTDLPIIPVPNGFRRENWILARKIVHEVLVHPSITWFPTKEIRDGLFIPGNYDIGLQLQIPVIDETGQDFSVSIRFRWYYDYRKLIAKDIPTLFSRKKE
jgi:hypothetical protein